MRQLQQGDVLFQEVKVLPKGVHKRKGQVVAEGEATGHAHKVDGGTLWELQRNGVTELYLEAPVPVTITHDEHKAIPIPPGVYQIGRVQEFDHVEQMRRAVID